VLYDRIYVHYVIFLFYYSVKQPIIFYEIIITNFQKVKILNHFIDTNKYITVFNKIFNMIKKKINTYFQSLKFNILNN